MGNKATAFLLVLLAVARLSGAVAAPPGASPPPWQACKDGQFPVGSLYRRNVRELLVSFPETVASSETLFATSSVGELPNAVHSMALCRGDLNATECRSCVASAILDAERLCPDSIEATIFHQTCFVTISNEAFLANTTDDIVIGSMDTNSMSSSHIFNDALGLLLNKTIRYAALRSARLFSKGEIGYGTGKTIYAVAQCLPHLNRSTCLLCLQVRMEMVLQLYSGSPGGTVQGTNCILTYDLTKFFAGVESLHLPALRPSSSPSSVKVTPPSSPPSSVKVTPSGSKRTGTNNLLIGLMAAAGSLLLLCISMLVWCLVCKRKSSRNERDIEALICCHGSIAPKRYNFAEITKMTASFNKELGKGGFGVVFKGDLDDGRQVAVKLLHDSKHNGEDFVNEILTIGRTSHVNVVSLLGFCLERSKRALVYEYMPKCSLDNYIYSENPKSILNWENLYKIALGVANGLEYLHDSCNTRIMHFDIKPQNILLDHNFNPKIADFGLAQLFYTKESKISLIGGKGTAGFMAPEVVSRTFGSVSTKCDVYSYGMLLLEMAGGRKNWEPTVQSSQQYFPGWIYEHYAQEDGFRACEITPEVEEIAKKMILIGLWCIQILPTHRPTANKVLEMFQRGSHEVPMPPKQSFSQIL